MKINKNKIIGFFRITEAVTSYMLALAFVIIFALFCSGRIGWFLLLSCVLAPVISLTSAYFACKYVEVALAVAGDTFSKGDRIEATLTVINRSYLPIATAAVRLTDDGHLTTDYRTIAISCLPRSKKTVKLDLYAGRAGGSTLGVESVQIKDFFSIKGFTVMSGSEGIISSSLGIIPHIMEIDSDTAVLKETLEAVADQGMSEDTLDEVSLTFGGNPGFDYREYVPGDPVKRINSKLSGKQDILMVRLDERQAIASVSIILNPCINDTSVSGDYHENLTVTEKRAALAEESLETVLGITGVLLSRELSVDIYIRRNTEWENLKLLDMKDLNSLQTYLADYFFINQDAAYIIRELEEMLDTCPGNIIVVEPRADYSQLMSISALQNASDRTISVIDVYSGEGRSV